MTNSFSGSPEVGGRDEDRKKPASDAGKKRGGSGSLNESDDREETRARGLTTNGLIEDAKAAFDGFASGPGQAREIESPDRPRSRPPKPEEEPELVLGDPDDLGGRARRRRPRASDERSEVLRRGLLGV